jgi:hypothetical protein
LLHLSVEDIDHFNVMRPSQAVARQKHKNKDLIGAAKPKRVDSNFLTLPTHQPVWIGTPQARAGVAGKSFFNSD